jgi:hypothetical protein
MRESCKYGSVRGASSNGSPYRDRRAFISLLGSMAARGTAQEGYTSMTTCDSRSKLVVFST